jgi:PAS domain S-box-containing protein
MARDASRQVMAFMHAEGRAISVRSTGSDSDFSGSTDRVGVLLQAAEGLGGAATEDEVLQHLAEVAGEDLGDAAGVWTLAGNRLVLRSGSGLPDRLPLEIESGPSAAWEVLKTRVPLVSSDVIEDPRFRHHPADRLIQLSGARALALVPLRTAGRSLGILAVAWRRPGLPTSELLRSLRQLASIGAVALDRAAAADSLASEHRLLEAVLDAASDGVLGLDWTRRVVFGNLRAQQILGRSEPDLTTEGWASIVFPDPDLRAAVLHDIFTNPGGSLRDPLEATLTHEDGQSRELQITSTRCEGPAGEPLVLVFLRDVTERRRARAQAMAQQNYSRLGRLAGGIAHDFNNLLGAIMGHADLIRNSPGADDRVVRRATTIAEAAVRGSRLSNRLLAFSGSGTIQPQSVDLGMEVERGTQLFQSTLLRGASR